MASGDLYDIPVISFPGGSNVPQIVLIDGNSSPAEKIEALAFDPSTVETIDFHGVMSKTYGGADIEVTIPFQMESDTSNNVHVEIAWRRRDGAEGINSTSHTYTFRSDTQAVPSAIGIVGEISVTFTQAQADSIAAGEPYVLRVRRAAANVLDTANSSDMYLEYAGIRVKEA